MLTKRPPFSLQKFDQSHRHLGFVFVLLIAATLACTPIQTNDASLPRPTEFGEGALLTVLNDSPEAICYLFISLPTNLDWGPDLLNTVETIAPIQSLTFALAPGNYDLRAEGCESGVAEFRGFSLTNAHEWAVEFQQP